MPLDVATLVVKYLADISDIKSKLGDLDKTTQALQQSAKKINTELTGLAGTINNTAGVLQASVQMFASVGLLGVGKNIALVAGRADELQRVMRITGKNAGYTASELDTAEKNMRGFGIATNEARQSITQMIQANISLSKSFQLARTAQDLAVIAGWNSSETLQRLIVNIQQADMLGLRFMGIVLDSAEAQREYAKATGIVGRELTRQEKTQATLAGVLKEGQKVYGAYEESMNSWSKTMRTTERYVQDFKIALGKDMQEPLLHLERGFQNLLSSFTNMEGTLTQGTGRFLLMGTAVASLFSGFQLLQRSMSWMAGSNEQLKNMLPMIKGVTGALILLSGTEVGRGLIDLLTKTIGEVASALSGLTKQAKEEFTDTTKIVMGLLGESAEIGLVGKFLFGMKTPHVLALMAILTAVGAIMKIYKNKEVDIVEEAEKRKTKVAKDEMEKREKELGDMLLQLKEQELIKSLGLDKVFAEIDLLQTEAAQKKELETWQEFYKKKIELETDKKQAERLSEGLRLVKEKLLGLTSAYEEASKAIETGLKQGPINKLELMERQIAKLQEQLKIFPDTANEILLNKLYEDRKKILDDLFKSFSKLAQEQYKLLAADIGDVGKEKLEAHKKAMDSAVSEYERLVDKLKEPVYEVGAYDSLTQIPKSEIYDEIGKSLDKVKAHYNAMLATAQETMKSIVSTQKDLLAPSIARVNKMYDDQRDAVIKTGETEESKLKLKQKIEEKLAKLEIQKEAMLDKAEKEARKRASSPIGTYNKLITGDWATDIRDVEKEVKAAREIALKKYNEDKALIENQKAATRVSKEAEVKELRRIEDARNRELAVAEEEIRDVKIEATKKVITEYKSAMAEQVSLHEKMVAKIRGLEEQRVNIIKAAEDRIKGLTQTAEEKKRELGRLGMAEVEAKEDKRREAEELLSKAQSEMVTRTPESLVKAKELAEKAMGKFGEIASKEDIRGAQNNIDRVTDALKRITEIDKEIKLDGIKAMKERAEALDKGAIQNIETLGNKLKELETSLSKLEKQKVIEIGIDNVSALAKITEVETALANIKNRIIDIQVRELPTVKEFQFGGVIRAAFGRYLSGYGGGDKIPVMAEAGEFVHRKEAVRHYGVDFMEALNSMRLPRIPAMASGGSISNSQSYTLNFQEGGKVPNLRIKSLMHEISAELRREMKRG